MTPSAHGQCWVRCHRAARRGRCAGVPAVAADVAGVGLGGGVAEGPQERQRQQPNSSDARSGRRPPAASAARALRARRRRGWSARTGTTCLQPTVAAPGRCRAAGTTRRPCARRRRTARRPVARVADAPAARLGCCACPPSCPSSSPCTTRRTSCRCWWSGSARCWTGSARRTRCWRSTTAAGTRPRCCCSATASTWPQLRVLRLRANAGHQAAISAGLARARGDFVATLDADLQDPPEVIAADARGGPARRASTSSTASAPTARTDSAFKRGSARAFYRLIRAGQRHHRAGRRGRLPADVAGPPSTRSTACPSTTGCCGFVVPALGFPSGEVRYRREVRAAGSSKYPLARMIRLSVDSLTGFSTAPLRLATWFGLGGGLAAFGLLVYALVAQLQRAHGRRLDVDRRRGGRRRRRAAAVPRAARRVHRPDVHA